jgi:hypothetical protein
MKKTYKTPTIEVFELKVQGMLASSVEISTGDYSGGAIQSHGDDSDWE